MYARIIHTYQGHTDLDRYRRYSAEPRYTVRVYPSWIFDPLCFLLVSVGHHDAFVGYRVVIDRACARTLSHSSATPLETAFNLHTSVLGVSFFHQVCGAQLMLLSPSGSAYLWWQTV